MPERSWGVELSRSALKDLERIGKPASVRILDKLDALSSDENPLRNKDVRALMGRLSGFHRFRVGEDGIIFELDSPNRRLGVLAIVPRGTGYR